MSSLEKQLKRLRIPDNNSLEKATKFKKKVSFLFTAKEASDIDNETIFALALNGLDELKLLNEQFQRFEETLFNESSKHLERSILNQEKNDHIDKQIKDYLLLLSSYILLKPAHKTLEWLIRKFQVQLYNMDDLLACVFPYHHSNIFARIVQLLNVTDTKWSWLVGVQKTGSPLPRTNIIGECICNPDFLSFVCGLTFRFNKDDNYSKSTSIPICATFYASSICGVLANLEKLSEEIVSCLLRHIIQGFKSNVKDIQAASYMILGQLVTKNTLQSTVMESLLSTMCKNAGTMLLEPLLMCISCLCTVHDFGMFKKKTFSSLCKLPNIATILCNLSHKFKMDSLLEIFLRQIVETTFKLVNGDEDENRELFKNLLLNMLKDVSLEDSLKKETARHMLLSYIKTRESHGGDSRVSLKLQHVMKDVMRTIQNRWQLQIDQVVEEYLVTLQNKENEERMQGIQDFVSMTLSNAGSQIVCETGSTLVLALHHPEPEFRKLALKKVSSLLKEPLENDDDMDFLKETLLLKLNDDNPAVVLAVLELNEGLINICNSEQLVMSLIKLLDKTSKPWEGVFEKVLNTLLNGSLLSNIPHSSDQISLHLLSLIFLTKTNVDNAKLVIKIAGDSPSLPKWLSKSLKKKSIKKALEKCTASDTQELAMFNTILIASISENIAALKNEEIIGNLMDQMRNNAWNKGNIIVYLMICLELLKKIEHRALKFELVSSSLAPLLSLVHGIGERKCKRVKDLSDTDDVEKDDGVIPINLLTCYIDLFQKKISKRLEFVKSKIYLCALQQFMTTLPPHDEDLLKDTWWPIDETGNKTSYNGMLVSVLEELLHGLARGSKFTFQSDFQDCLQTMIKTQFGRKEHFLKFLSYIWSSTVQFESDDFTSKLSAITLIQTIHIGQSLLKSLDQKTMKTVVSTKSSVIPSLLVCLTNPIMAVRRCVLQTFSVIASCSTRTETSAVALCNFVCGLSEEIATDETYVISALQRFFSSDEMNRQSPGKTKHKRKKHNTSNDMLDNMLDHVIDESTPAYVIRVMLAILDKVISEKFLLKCLPLMKSILKKHQNNQEIGRDYSQIFLYLTNKFAPSTVSLFNGEKDVYEMFQCLLSLSKPMFVGHLSPQEAILNQMSSEFFHCINEEHIQNEILEKLIDVLMQTSDSKISIKLRDVLKEIPLSAKQIHVELTKLADAENSFTPTSKTIVSDDWYSSLGEFWQRVVVIIELLQTKDNILQPESLLPTLFKILSLCLEMSEPASSDYLRQLVLSTILKISQACVDQDKMLTKGLINEEDFSVEQLIHCIRVSGNPQTHHHALSLLAIAARLFPEKVLHNVMSIFTFMGINVLRQDDTYSFQVIQKTVEAVIPALIQAERRKNDIRTLVTKILRVFVDAFPHVPEHRRLPVFIHLLTTLGSSNYLHICIALLLEKIQSKKEGSAEISNESCQLFCYALCGEFTVETEIITLIHHLKCLTSLPEEKPKGHNRKRLADNSGIVFDVNSHSEKQLQLFKISGIDFILGTLKKKNFKEKTMQLSDEKRENMDTLYLGLLEESLKYISSISQLYEIQKQEETKRYLRHLLQKLYDVVEKVGDLLPKTTFINIIAKLIQNKNATTRKKAFDLFNRRMVAGSHQPSEQQNESLLVLLDALLLALEKEEIPSNKQSAFNMAIVLSRLLGGTHTSEIKQIFTVAFANFSDKEAKPQVASSALNCIAELCSLLKVHVIPLLGKFLPTVLNIIDTQKTDSRNDMLLLSALTVIHKSTQSLPNFVSPYLKNILMLVALPSFEENPEEIKSGRRKQITQLISDLRDDIAVLIKPRILIPNIAQCYNNDIVNANYESVIVLFNIVSKCVVNMSKEDVKTYNNQLLTLFMSALDYRSQYGQIADESGLSATEDCVIDAFLHLIMRLSESLFRPMFLKLIDWATRSSSSKLRILVFYHLADRMAEKLKGLFVLFAGYIIKSTTIILDANNDSKSDKLFFINEDLSNTDEAVLLSHQLLCYILDCLHKCFLYDNQKFVNKERFDRLVNPLVNQIANQGGANELFKDRVTQHLAPCIAQFAVAAGSESYWKIINQQICLKTRNSSARVRLAALNVLRELNNKLGEGYLVLLPEIIPFLAELMEDESFEVEKQCQDLISEMENVLGESLQKYF